MDLGVSDLARPSTDYVKHSKLVYAYSSNYERVVGMNEFGMILVMSIAATMVIFWLVVGGEGED